MLQLYRENEKFLAALGANNVASFGRSGYGETMGFAFIVLGSSICARPSFFSPTLSYIRLVP